MIEPNSLSPEERQDLVAYLDGELDAEAARAVVTKLSQSAAHREELERLRQTWDMLDYLPRPKAATTFTQQTVQKLQTIKMSTALRHGRWRLAGAACWAAGIFAAGILSFMLMQQQPGARLPEPTAEDLRVLEHHDYWQVYKRIDGVEFLRELDHPDLFGEDS
jgi:anti-sigma factor RsiW